MAVHAEALAGGAEPGEQDDGEGVEEQQPVAPLRVRDADRAEAHAEAQILGVPEAGLNRPPFRVEFGDLRRGRGAVSSNPAPGLLHALGVHAHGRADRAVRLGDRSIAQLARPAALADPVLRRARRPVGRANPGVAFEPDHVVKAQFAEEVEQLRVGEAAVGQDGGAPVMTPSVAFARDSTRLV